MRLDEKCVKCMYDRQVKKTGNPEYLKAVKDILENRDERACSTEMNIAFNEAYEEYIGPVPSVREESKQYNDLVLSLEKDLIARIEASSDPLATSLALARVGNYIDFAVMQDVNEETFLDLIKENELNEDDIKTYNSFIEQCSRAKNFLLLTDNCGEIVLDKLMLQQLRKRFPDMEITVMVRGGEASSDAILEDAEYIGMTKEFKVITNGEKAAGTVYRRLPQEAKEAIDSADVILSKGQANYESFAGEGFHAFFAFLCKCELFVNRFNVPRLTGMFVEE